VRGTLTAGKDLKPQGGLKEPGGPDIPKIILVRPAEKIRGPIIPWDPHKRGGHNRAQD